MTPAPGSRFVWDPQIADPDRPMAWQPAVVVRLVNRGRAVLWKYENDTAEDDDRRCLISVFEKYARELPRGQQ